MQIFRIESKNNPLKQVYEGPYFNSCGGSSMWRVRSHNSKNLPICDEDKILVKNYQTFISTHTQFKNTDFFCGFTSTKQLTNWFSPQELFNLKSNGFIIATYESEYVVGSPKQALFIPTSERIFISEISTDYKPKKTLTI